MPRYLIQRSFAEGLHIPTNAQGAPHPPNSPCRSRHHHVSAVLGKLEGGIAAG